MTGIGRASWELGAGSWELGVTVGVTVNGPHSSQLTVHSAMHALTLTHCRSLPLTVKVTVSQSQSQSQSLTVRPLTHSLTHSQSLTEFTTNRPTAETVSE